MTIGRAVMPSYFNFLIKATYTTVPVYTVHKIVKHELRGTPVHKSTGYPCTGCEIYETVPRASWTSKQKCKCRVPGYQGDLSTTISPYPGTPVLSSGEVKGISCEDGETNFELLRLNTQIP